MFFSTFLLFFIRVKSDCCYNRVWFLKIGAPGSSPDAKYIQLHKEDQMKLLHHDAKGATMHLDGKELLMMMALVQEGRESFECKSPTGQALDELVSRAVMLVNEKARKDAA